MAQQEGAENMSGEHAKSILRLGMTCHELTKQVIESFGAPRDDQHDVGFLLPSIDDRGVYKYLQPGKTGYEYFAHAVLTYLRWRGSIIKFDEDGEAQVFQAMPDVDWEAAKTCVHKLWCKGQDYSGDFDIPPLGTSVSAVTLRSEGQQSSVDLNLEQGIDIVCAEKDITEKADSWPGWSLDASDVVHEARKVAQFIDYFHSPKSHYYYDSNPHTPCMDFVDPNLWKKQTARHGTAGLDGYHVKCAKNFFIEQQRGILLDGPPGTGKTTFSLWFEKIARGLTVVHRPRKTRKTAIQPGGDDVNVYRAIFQRGTSVPWLPVLLMIDELEDFALSRLEGGTSDLCVTMMLTYLRVVKNTHVIGETNRKVMIDAAVLRHFLKFVGCCYFGLPGWEARRDWNAPELPEDLFKFLLPVRHKFAQLTLNFSHRCLAQVFNRLQATWREMHHTQASEWKAFYWQQTLFKLVTKFAFERDIRLGIGTYTVRCIYDEEVDVELAPFLQYVGQDRQNSIGAVLLDMSNGRLELREGRPEDVVRVYTHSHSATDRMRPLNECSALKLMLELARQRSLHVRLTDEALLRIEGNPCKELKRIYAEMANQARIMWIVVLDAPGVLGTGGDAQDQQVENPQLLADMLQLHRFARIDGLYDRWIIFIARKTITSEIFRESTLWPRKVTHAHGCLE